jgi:hypothetical protein
VTRRGGWCAESTTSSRERSEVEEVVDSGDEFGYEDGYDEGLRYVIGVDLGLTSDRTGVVIAHGERLAGHEEPTVGARVVVDRVQLWQGSRRQPVQLDAVED